MSLWTYYHTPSTIDEALDLLQSYQGRAQVVAGGTDLLLDIRQGTAPRPEALIDITRIDSLNVLCQEGDSLLIGAAVTHSQIVQSAVITHRATCLVESCGVVGGPQVRNVGTLGGNVAHALPAGDGTTSLVALDVEAEVVINRERQWKPIRELFCGPGESLLDHSRDLLIQFRIKLCGVHEGSAFKRIMRPQGVALPILGCAVWILLDENGESYREARVCIGPVASIPTRITAIEAALRDQPADDTTLDHAVEVAQQAIHPRTSKYRATASYRREMIEVLLRRVLPLAVSRARTGEVIPEGVGIE